MCSQTLPTTQLPFPACSRFRAEIETCSWGGCHIATLLHRIKDTRFCKICYNRSRMYDTCTLAAIFSVMVSVLCVSSAQINDIFSSS